MDTTASGHRTEPRYQSHTPQEVIGGLRPRPKKESAVSPSIIAGIDSETEAMRWLAKLGSRCRPMMRCGRAPINCAAVQKSSSRKARSFERTARARPGQSSRPKMMVMPKNIKIGDQVTGKAADSAIHNGNCGNELTISIKR